MMTMMMMMKMMMMMMMMMMLMMVMMMIIRVMVMMTVLLMMMTTIMWRSFTDLLCYTITVAIPAGNCTMSRARRTSAAARPVSSCQVAHDLGDRQAQEARRRRECEGASK